MKKYIIYVMFYLLTIAFTNIEESFMPLLFTNVKGLTTAEFSYVNSSVVVCEVITILLLGKFLKKYSTSKMLLISGLLYFIKMIILSFTSLPVYILIPAALLRGVAWGILLFVHIKHIIKLVGIENVVSATIILTTATSLFKFIMTNVVGYLIENNGYDFSYKLIALIILVSTIGYYIFNTITKNKVND